MMPLRVRGLKLSTWLIVTMAAVFGQMAATVKGASAFDASRVEPSVYKIYTFVRVKDDQFAIVTGTGFLVAGQTSVLTNYHVVEGGERFYIAYRAGSEAKIIEARRIEVRPNVDLALLEAREDLPGRPLKIGDYEPQKLSDVVAIGYPGAANLNNTTNADARSVQLTELEATVTSGIVSRMTYTNLKVTDAQILSARTVQHNAAINPGNSGGPLLDQCGLVVGVNTLRGVDSQGLFFSIHASEVTRFLSDQRVGFSSTARACSGSDTLDVMLPLIFGMTATLAAGAFYFSARRRGAGRVLGDLKGMVERVLPRGGGVGAARKAPARERSHGGDGAELVLRPVAGGKVLKLDASGRALRLGRSAGADLVIDNDTVSKTHAKLAWDQNGGAIEVTDLGSSNGTFLDGARITTGRARAGDRLRFGTVEFEVVANTARSAGGRAAQGWMLSGFDSAGRAVQFELVPMVGSDGRPVPDTWTIGRDQNRAKLVIDDSSVSSLHAQLMFDPGEPLRLRDMGSSNGTRIDGVEAGQETVTLSDTGHEIAFGLATLRLSKIS